MIHFTYRYIGRLIIALFACTSLLVILSHSDHIWYAYTIPAVLSWGILTSRNHKVAFVEDYLMIKGMSRKSKIDFKDIRKIELSKDPFFYGKTLSIHIYLKNGSYQKYNIGTLRFSYISELDKILKNRL